jgi:hypothetical protein
MAVRALIIAIEAYPNAGGMAKTLEGTLQAGIDFRNWLQDKLKTEGRDGDAHIIFCSSPVQASGRAATSRDIRDALKELKEKGRSSTEELFVFFSGHGFAFVQGPGSRPDIVISSDYVDETDIQCFFKVDSLVAWLRDHLGPGKHYYFIDACRNHLTSSQVGSGGQLPWDSQVLADASSFVLQSTVSGSVGSVKGLFPQALLKGLKGQGKAKLWDDNDRDAMVVRYDSLRSYLKETLHATQPITSKVEGELGESDVVFMTIKPVPNVRCTIEIQGYSQGDQGTITAQRHRAPPSGPESILDAPHVLELQPDRYVFDVTINGIKGVPLFANAVRGVDLYEDMTLSFQKVAVGGALNAALEKSGFAAPPAAELARVEFDIPANSQGLLHNLETGEEFKGSSEQTLRLPPGAYAATVRDRDHRLLLDTKLELSARERITLRPSSSRVSIAQQLPSGDQGLFFSESMGGGVADPDLNLWLSLLGAGRILGPRGDYSKLAPFPLHNFVNERRGTSPLYVLAALEGGNTDARFEVGLTPVGNTSWQEAGKPMPGIREAYFRASPGAQLVSFRLDGGPSYTVASHTAPNRAMLITLSLDAEGELYLCQYLLPLGHLVEWLPREVQNRLQGRNHLNDVRFITQVSRAFRKRQQVLELIQGEELDDLLHTKWLDPIAASLAAYELLRRGKSEDIPEVVANLTEFFQDFPDAAALARLNGQDVARPPGPPLFLDGLRAFPNYAEWLPLPAGYLDFTSPWTAWRGAVPGNTERRE